MEGRSVILMDIANTVLLPALTPRPIALESKCRASSYYGPTINPGDESSIQRIHYRFQFPKSQTWTTVVVLLGGAWGVMGPLKFHS
jgi:hypothetical protein